MNLDIVKYPWLLFKFKGPGKMEVEVQGGNLETLPLARLERLLPVGQKHVRLEQVNFRRATDRARKAAAAEEIPAEEVAS